ncbi:alpha-1,6-mannosyltransferase Och1 [Savitreella phatthalungensis]
MLPRFLRFVIITSLLLLGLYVFLKPTSQTLEIRKPITDDAKAKAAAAAKAAADKLAAERENAKKKIADAVAKSKTDVTSGKDADAESTPKKKLTSWRGTEPETDTWSYLNEPIELDPVTHSATLKDRLMRAFPYDRSAVFPSFIWQTWKYGPSDEAFNFRMQEATWSEKHPAYIHEVIKDDVADLLIRHLFTAKLPEVVEAWDALPHVVMRADFFRYLILFARGGIYSDIDTQALQPAWQWVPGLMDYGTYGLVVGIEADPDRPDWRDWYSRRIQFVQWTIRAKPGHPALAEVISRITRKTLELKAKGTLKVDKESNSVVEWTGPAVWTDSIFKYLNSPLMRKINAGNVPPMSAVGKTDPSTGLQVGSSRSGIPAVLPLLVRDASLPDSGAAAAGNDAASTSPDSPGKSGYTWRDLTGITEAQRVGDVVVLPITGFSPGQGHMGSLDYDNPHAMVRHDFEGSWKPDSEQIKPVAGGTGSASPQTDAQLANAAQQVQAQIQQAEAAKAPARPQQQQQQQQAQKHPSTGDELRTAELQKAAAVQAAEAGTGGAAKDSKAGVVGVPAAVPPAVQNAQVARAFTTSAPQAGSEPRDPQRPIAQQKMIVPPPPPPPQNPAAASAPPKRRFAFEREAVYHRKQMTPYQKEQEEERVARSKAAEEARSQALKQAQAVIAQANAITSQDHQTTQV